MNEMKYRRITDRTCYRAELMVDVNCLAITWNKKSKSNTVMALRNRMVNVMEKRVASIFSNRNAVPYAVFNKISCKLNSCETIETDTDKADSVNFTCRIDITFEEVENAPEMLAQHLITFFFNVCKTKTLTFTPTKFYSSGDDANYTKGYIQSDNSIYYLT